MMGRKLTQKDVAVCATLLLLVMMMVAVVMMMMMLIMSYSLSLSSVAVCCAHTGGRITA